MLAPREIINKRFDKSAFGYKVDEVDKYLSAVADDYAKLISERNEYEKNMTMIASKLEEYKKDENNLSAVLLGAQKLGDSIIKEAKNKAELIIRDAGIKSDKMLEGTHRQLEREKHELARVQKEVTVFKARVLDIYKSHLELVSALPESEDVGYTEIQQTTQNERGQFDNYIGEDNEPTMYMDKAYGGSGGSLSDLAEGISIEADLDQMDDGGQYSYSDDGTQGYQSEPIRRTTPGFVPDLGEQQPDTDKPFVFNENFEYEDSYGATDVIKSEELGEQQQTSGQSKFGELRFGQGYDLNRDSAGKKKKKRRG